MQFILLSSETVNESELASLKISQNCPFQCTMSMTQTSQSFGKVGVFMSHKTAGVIYI